MSKKVRPKTVVVAVRFDQETYELVKAIVAGLSADDAGNYTASGVIRSLVRRYGSLLAEERGVKLPRRST